MTILDQRPGYQLWLDGGKMYDRQDNKTREIVGIAKEMLLAMYGAEGCSDAKMFNHGKFVLIGEQIVCGAGDCQYKARRAAKGGERT